MADDNKNFSIPVKKIMNPEYKENIKPLENSIEKIKVPEQTLEKGAEQLPERNVEIPVASEGVTTPEYKGGIMTTTKVSQKFLARQKRIESILEEDLEDIFKGLPPRKQIEFKLAGEQAAKEINGMLAQAKIKINKILELIKRWLFLVPGINKFFVEQEAKIKADAILKINDEFKEQ